MHDHELVVRPIGTLAGAPTGVWTDVPAGGQDCELVFKLQVDRRAGGRAGRRLGLAAHGVERWIS